MDTDSLCWVHISEIKFSPIISQILIVKVQIRQSFNSLITIFTLHIETPYLLALKFEIAYSTTSCCVLNIALCMVNNVDRDQTPHSVASNLGLHCF